MGDDASSKGPSPLQELFDRYLRERWAWEKAEQRFLQATMRPVDWRRVARPEPDDHFLDSMRIHMVGLNDVFSARPGRE